MSNDAIRNYIGFVLKNLVSIPILNLAGLESEARMRAKHMDEIVSIHERSAERAERADKRRHEEQIASSELQGKFFDLLTHNWTTNAARDAISPVGRACDCMEFSNGEEIDTVTPEMAKFIRSGKRYLPGKIEAISVFIEGFSRKNRSLQITNPYYSNKTLTAYVLDPAFRDIPNDYTEAANLRKPFSIYARPLFRGDQIAAMEVLGKADDGRMFCDRCLSVMDYVDESEGDEGMRLTLWSCPKCGNTQESESKPQEPFNEDFRRDL